MKEYSADTGEVITDAIIEYAELALDTIVASPTNPRKRFNSAKMAELAASIKTDEVHEPIEAMTVMKTIESEDAHELSLLTDLIDKIEAALNPAAKGVLL